MVWNAVFFQFADDSLGECGVATHQFHDVLFHIIVLMLGDIDGNALRTA